MAGPKPMRTLARTALDRRRLLLAAAGTAWLGAAGHAGAAARARAGVAVLAPAAAATLRDLLARNHLPFWRRVCDRPAVEGFAFNYDLAGRWLGPHNRLIVGQARALWLFAHLLRSPFVAAGDAALAAHGFAYLTQRLWDPVHGGFFWEVSWRDHSPTLADKHLYGQAFGLYALSEYALATGSADARAWADQVALLIDQRFRVASLGNYREFLSRDWSPPPASRRGYLGYRPDVRTQNTRIHLLEALTLYARLNPTPTSLARLAEALRLTEAAVRRSPACYFRQIDPTPTTPAATEASYGHDVETVHLMRAARAVLGLAGEPAFYDRVLLDSFRLGEDPLQGGLYQYGPIGAAATQRDKVAWVEAEALLATCTSFARTRHADHRRLFLRTLAWVRDHQADWARGGWYGTIDPAGVASGLKADEWSGGYHVGRALIDGLAALEGAG